MRGARGVNQAVPAPSHLPDARLLGVLRRAFSFDAFRPHQHEIVRAILDGRDVFAARPTGGGKSLCYQLPALVREGLALVVSPLISLMKDQVDGAREDGIAAAFLNSSLDEEEARATWRELAAGRVRLLYVSPERLALPDFRAALCRFGVSLVAIDEAHCVLEWGHEFRPEYRSLVLLRAEFPGAPMAAFTATATRQVQDDVVRQLGLRSPLVVRASFDRPELFCRVAPKEGVGDAQVQDFVRRHRGQSGIVYRSTRKAVERTAGFITGRGVSAVAYHAGMEDGERRERQEAFIRDTVPVVVATIAIGMGIDKPDVRLVVHADLPRSLEGYYQKTGRAARDGESADTLPLHGPEDLAAARWCIGQAPSPAERRRAEDRLAALLWYVESGRCRRVPLLAHFDEHHPGSCGRCDVCAGEAVIEDLTESAWHVLSAAARTRKRFEGHHLADILVGSATDTVLERGHQHLPELGAGRDRDCGFWLSLVRALEADGLIGRGEGRIAGYALTGDGRPAQHRRPPAGGGDGSGRRTCRRRGPGVAVPTPARRAARARAKKMPPCVIFADRTLREMARPQPLDVAGLRRRHGVGEAKLAAYGREFLAQIRSRREGRHGTG